MWLELLAWSKKEFSQLPWRKERSLYGTLVSEIMLQQTTVSTVLNHYQKFIDHFDSIKSLAQAQEEEVCRYWQGLGYYRRARNLHKAAITITQDHQAKFPKSYEQLLSIAGIGQYTANALLAIGSNQKALAIDANLERVLSRIYAIDEMKGPKLIKRLYQDFEAQKILKDVPQNNWRGLNEALMDLGRVFCQAKRVYCLDCPMKQNCQAFLKNSPLDFPMVVKEQEEKKNLDLHLLRIVVQKAKGKIITTKRQEGQWLSGQLEVPTFILDCEQKGLDQYPLLPKKLRPKNLDRLGQFKTSITKYKITNYVLKIGPKDFEAILKGMKISPRHYQAHFLDDANLHFTTATKKIFKLEKSF